MPIYMSFDDMRDIYLFNNARREALLAEALKQPVSTVKYKTKKALSELKELLKGDVENENV